jgi:XTP/dITP diphosphohydrolase
MIIVATRNRHKAAEIGAILGMTCLALDDLPGAPELIEDGETFAENAAGKALQLAKWLVAQPGGIAALQPGEGTSPSGQPQSQPDQRIGEGAGKAGFPTGEPAPTGKVAIHVLADDSGLEVDALNGAPGVVSARFAALDSGAKGNSTDALNNAKLLRLLQPVPLEKRTARFRCVLALVEMGPGRSVGQPRVFEGTCEGRIGFAPKGAGGFGYDPLFFPKGYGASFAELGEALKNRISHRAQALGRLRDALVPVRSLPGIPH